MMVSHTILRGLVGVHVAFRDLQTPHCNELVSSLALVLRQFREQRLRAADDVRPLPRLSHFGPSRTCVDVHVFRVNSRTATCIRTNRLLDHELPTRLGLHQTLFHGTTQVHHDLLNHVHAQLPILSCEVQ